MEKNRHKRTDVDFSKHDLTIIKRENYLLHDLKSPDFDYTERVKFINIEGVLVVTGDYGNWIFCREFHPSSQGYVSDNYWIGIQGRADDTII